MSRRVVRGEGDDPLDPIGPLDPLDPIEPLHPTGRPAHSRARRTGSLRPLLALGAAAAVVLGVLTVLDHGSGDGGGQPRSAAAPTSATTGADQQRADPSPIGPEVETESSGSKPTSTGAAPPIGLRDLAPVPVPTGADGVIYGLTSAGDLLEVDLRDGATRLLTFGGTVRASTGDVDVLEDGLLVSHRGEVRVVPYDDPLGRPDRIPGVVVGADGRSAILGDQRATNRFSLLRGDGAQDGPFDLGRDLTALAAVGDRVAVAAGGRIGLLDPRSGDTRAVAVGDVVDADGNGLVWRDCTVLTACRLRAGPWSDVGRRDLTDQLPVLEGGVDAEFTPVGATGPPATATGTLLRISTFPEDGRGATHLLVDLASGATHALPSGEVEVTPSGRWLVRATGASALELTPVATGGSVDVLLPTDLDLIDLAIGTRRLVA